MTQKQFTNLIGIFALLLSVLSINAQTEEIKTLPPEQTIERELAGGQTHKYKIEAKANDFLQIKVEQKGIDVVVKLFDADGKRLAEMDSPNGTQGFENLNFIIGDAGFYRVEISSLEADAAKGNYTIFQEKLRLATEKDRKILKAKAIFNEAMTLFNQQTQKSDQEAHEKFLLASRLYQEIKDNNNEAQSLLYAGFISNFLGDNQRALESFIQALSLFRQAKNKSQEAVTLNNIGAVYDLLGEKQKALDYYNQALFLRREVGDKEGEAAALSNIGDIYYDLGDNQKALKYFAQALPLRRQVGDKEGESTTLNNIASVHNVLGEKVKALVFYNQALLIFKQLKNEKGEAFTLANIGAVYEDLDEEEKALEFFNRALPLRRKIGDKSGEAATLANIGSAYDDLGQKQKALEFYSQALLLLSQIGDKSGKAITLHNVMYVWESLNNPKTAIFYGKQSVNNYQQLRSNIKGLDSKTQKTYLETIEKTYKKLADLLISEGRITEAEQVLQMLKEEEVFDYLSRDASETDKLSQRADLTPQEKDALKRYEEIADKITALGAEFAELDKLGEKRTAEQQKRFDELSNQLADANRSFQVFLRQLADEFNKRTNTEKDLQENLGLQADLKSWGDDVVFVYTLVGEERFRTILVTPDTQTDGKTEIKAADLNEKIIKFRAALQDPRVDPRPLGKELYDILIKPIEKQLNGAKAKTLLWSLDGNLRLLPLAALWDGEQYFGQKYENVTVTLASRTRLGDAVSKDWRVLGLGVSEGKTVKRPDGSRDVTFAPLFAVKEELASIVKTAPNETGVLDGRKFLNSEFTEDNLKKELPKNYKVVHIASHFSLNPGDATQSFLLLGDGNALTVDEIKNNPQIKFGGVELLTLSACQTAVVEKDSTGKEIEGFGYAAQQKGAEAILATLWNVADESTQIFMSEFYRLRKENPQVTKAEAIRRVQKAMITGEFEPQTEEGKRRSGVYGKTNKPQSFIYDAKKPFAHPFFWSPFVLIGNWK